MTLALFALMLLTLTGAGFLVLTGGRRERRVLAGRIAAIRPGIARGRAPRARPTLKLPRVAAPLLDPVLGIDRSVASDEPLPLAPWLLVGALAAGFVATALRWLLGVGDLYALPIGLVAGVFAARLAVQGRRDGIRARMEDEFAMALGVIIRCVRAGLPVNEGMRAVAAEVPAPTGPEFRRCVDQIQLGESFDGALAAMAKRCALADYRFFATSVGLQRQTGGNLAETLDNLAETIRKRKAIRLKAQALTSEAKATVAVLAILPAGVCGLLMFVNPGYVTQLFTTDSGKNLLGAALLIQAFGLFVIRTIIRSSLR